MMHAQQQFTLRSQITQLLAIVALTMLGTLTAAASGQCRLIDFEQFADGTPITTIYPGVTFSNVTSAGGIPGYCHTPRILSSPPGGTSSPSRGLTMWSPGCDEFNTNRRLRMVFDHLQNHVSFTLGNYTSQGNWNMVVRWYNNAGSLLGTRNVTVGTGVYHLVTIGSDGGPNNIRRIDIDPTPSVTYAVIDDLRFGSNEPPTVRIDSPSYATCHCGNSSLNIFGETCSVQDGTFAAEIHEYRPVNAAPGTPWTHIISYSSAFCGGGGTLHSWNTSSVPHGRYYYRVTVMNTCGRSESDITVVVVSHQFGTLQMTSPAAGETVCGKVELIGTVNSGCGTCYTVEYRPVGSGTYQPVDPSNPQYCGGVSNCRFATWDVDALGLPNGQYEIRIIAENNCGQTASLTRIVNVDNSQCDCLGDINTDGVVDIDDLFLLLGNWGTCN